MSGPRAAPCATRRKSRVASSPPGRNQHSKAYATLTTQAANDIAKAKGITTPAAEAPACLKCHAIVGDAKADVKDGVQCESCHGAGADYKAMGVMKVKADAIAKGMMAFPDKAAIEAMCKNCHNEQSPTAKPFNFERSGPRSSTKARGLYVNPAQLREEPAYERACLSLHCCLQASFTWAHRRRWRRRGKTASPVTATRRSQRKAPARKPISLFADEAVLNKSTHAKLACVACHTGFNPDDLPHKATIEPVACQRCHASAVFKHQFHRGASRAAGSELRPGALCKDCHGTHDVESPKTQARSSLQDASPSRAGRANARRGTFRPRRTARRWQPASRARRTA